MAQQQPLAHLLAPQIDVAEPQAHFLAHVLIELKRQRLRAIQDLERLAQELDFPGLQIGVHGAGRPQAHSARDFQHELVAHPLGLSEDLRRIRVENDLKKSLAVAQVDEDDTAVIAPAMRPAGHGDDLADQRFADLTAIVSAHKL